MSDSSTAPVAFITGANRGMGLETARQLATLGVLVVIGSRSAKAGQDAVAFLAAAGLDVSSIVIDVTSKADHQAAFGHFEQVHGRLDILVNNAGIHHEANPPIPLYTTSTTPEVVLRETMEANFFSTVALTDTMLPLLQRSAAGRIVNLSSILGSLTLMADPTSPIYEMKAFGYDTSKAALNSYTIHLAHELRGTAIKVNSAHPGWVRTDMGGPNGNMSIEDGAKTSVTLATLPDDGPSGGFFHLGQPLPW